MLNRPVRFMAIRSAFDVDSDSAGKAALGEDIHNRGSSNGLRRRERSHHRLSGNLGWPNVAGGNSLTTGAMLSTTGQLQRQLAGQV